MPFGSPSQQARPEHIRRKQKPQLDRWICIGGATVLPSADDPSQGANFGIGHTWLRSCCSLLPAAAAKVRTRSRPGAVGWAATRPTSAAVTPTSWSPSLARPRSVRPVRNRGTRISYAAPAKPKPATVTTARTTRRLTSAIAVQFPTKYFRALDRRRRRGLGRCYRCLRESQQSSAKST